MFRNQNFEPDPTSHFTDTLSESEMAQKRARTQFLFVLFYISKKIVSSARQTAVTLRLEKKKKQKLGQEVARLGADQALLR